MTNTTHPKELIELTELENQVKIHQINPTDSLNVSLNDKNIILKNGNLCFSSQLNNQIKFQLGIRIWHTQSLMDIKYKWESERINLQDYILHVLIRQPIWILYFSKSGQNIIYGIVGKDFKPINQLNFRLRVLQSLTMFSEVNFEKHAIGINRGIITETFQLKSELNQSFYNYQINYAKNNGYSSFYISVGRGIIICENGLTEFYDKQKFNLRHNKTLDEVDEFISSSMLTTLKNRVFIEQQIQTLKDIYLDSYSLSQLIMRLHVAQAVKNKLKLRISEEEKNTGKTEWSLSQALTWLGTHDKHLTYNTKKVLRNAGTSILEQGLKQYITDVSNVYTDREGGWGSLLPFDLINRN